MILYLEHKKPISANKQMQQICRIQINTQNQLCFYGLAMNNMKKKLRKQLHLQYHPKEYTGINLIKEDLYTEN